ncbi:MAG: hypothetical protein LBI60_01280 [Bacteroidales bacterium]|jgi:hypothetical protein|nr:hypothetical protein [Bacteroidales bacterium]
MDITRGICKGNMRKLLYSAILILSMSGFPLYCQEIGTGDPETLVVRNRQWDIYATLHTNGIGIGFRIGKEPSIRIRRGFDVEYTYYRHFKERRKRVDYSNIIVYGKLNYFGQLRGGYGLTRVLNGKPYWGGVEVGYFFYGGVSLGFSVPVYLKIYTGEAYVSERYDPEKHNLGNILSKDSFGKGVKSIKIHPGLYVKTGMSFDFSKNDALVVKLDFGVAADAYFLPVEKLALSPKQYFLFTGFVTIHLGKRLAIYD